MEQFNQFQLNVSWNDQEELFDKVGLSQPAIRFHELVHEPGRTLVRVVAVRTIPLVWSQPALVEMKSVLAVEPVLQSVRAG